MEELAGPVLEPAELEIAPSRDKLGTLTNDVGEIDTGTEASAGAAAILSRGRFRSVDLLVNVEAGEVAARLEESLAAALLDSNAPAGANDGVVELGGESASGADLDRFGAAVSSSASTGSGRLLVLFTVACCSASDK